MKNTEQPNIEILSPSPNQIYEQRETGVTHSPFQLEYPLFQAIREGNTTEVGTAIQNYLKHGLIVGRLSRNTLRQMQYWAVSCISVAIHYAILGGLDETDAFNLSDIYIRQVDQVTSIEEIIPYLKEKALELTGLVEKTKYKRAKSPAIRRCLHYINIHLHDKLPIALLAKECKLSRDYLSVLFKKEMGISLHNYILKEKLEASKLLLLQNQNYDTISYTLGFCSETHYITCFRRRFGMTPGEYKMQHKHL